MLKSSKPNLLLKIWPNIRFLNPLIRIRTFQYSPIYSHQFQNWENCENDEKDRSSEGRKWKDSVSVIPYNWSDCQICHVHTPPFQSMKEEDKINVTLWRNFTDKKLEISMPELVLITNLGQFGYGTKNTLTLSWAISKLSHNEYLFFFVPIWVTRQSCRHSISNQKHTIWEIWS